MQVLKYLFEVDRRKFNTRFDYDLCLTMYGVLEGITMRTVNEQKLISPQGRYHGDGVNHENVSCWRRFFSIAVQHSLLVSTITQRSASSPQGNRTYFYFFRNGRN